MKTKKKFFLKAAGISPVKGAGISLALVMMFAMAFAACDNGTSSGKGGGTIVPDGPTVLGDGPTAADWTAAKGFLTAVGVDDVIYIRELMRVTSNTSIPYGKTLVVIGTGKTNASVAELPEEADYAVSTLPNAPRLIIPNGVKLTVESGGTLVLGGPNPELYAGIVDIQEGGALRVEKGATFSINMSSRVSVNGTNPAMADYSDGYIALNLESGSILSVLGNFVTGDNIIEKTSADRALINILTSTAPVAIGAVDVYDSFPPGDEVSGTLRGALNDGKKVATVDSPIKVANTPDEVTTLIEDVMIRPSAQWFPQRIIYSGDAALGDSAKELKIPNNTRLIVERNVTQNKDVTIKKQPLISSGAAYGILEIADGASITVTNNSTLTLPAGGGGLTVENGGTLAVAKGSILDLSTVATTDTGRITLYGEIKVAAGGKFNLPPINMTTQTMPQINWGTGEVTGFVTLAAGSEARTSLNDTQVYYIGPEAKSSGPEYSWTAGDTASTVTLVGSDMTLNGYLKVTTTTAIAKQAIIETGTLTVAEDLRVRSGAKLTVLTGAKVEVEDGAALDLSDLDASDSTTGDKGAVTLAGNGTIEVKAGGTIRLPALAGSGAEKNKIAEIKYEGTAAAIKLDLKSTALLGGAAYVGEADDTPLWAWVADDKAKSSVELKADGDFVVTGNLTSVGDSDENTILTKLTVNGSNSTLTVPAGKTLTLDEAGRLDVRGGGTILLAEDSANGGKLDLEALKSATGTPAVTISGTIDVGKNAVLVYPVRGNNNWAYVGSGKAKVVKDGMVKFGTTGGENVVGDTSPLFDFSAGSPVDSFVEFGATGMSIGGKGEITMADDTNADKPGNAIPQSHTWSITNGATLTIAASTTLTVYGSLHVQNGGNLKFADTTAAPTGGGPDTRSKLILKENRRPQPSGGVLKLGNGGDGANTVITTQEGRDYELGSDAVITVDTVTATVSPCAVLALTMDVRAPDVNQAGTSTAQAGNRDARITTGSSLKTPGAGIINTANISSITDVVADSRASIPDAKGFGVGVSISADSGTGVILVGDRGATYPQ